MVRAGGAGDEWRGVLVSGSAVLIQASRSAPSPHNHHPLATRSPQAALPPPPANDAHMHAKELLAMVLGWYVPEGQTLQAARPREKAYWPAGQDRQRCAP